MLLKLDIISHGTHITTATHMLVIWKNVNTKPLLCLGWKT